MSDGLCMRFREMAPQQGLLELAFSEISSLHAAWPETLQCDIVMSRHGNHDGEFDALVELNLGRRERKISGAANCPDPYAALRDAFKTLRPHIPERP